MSQNQIFRPSTLMYADQKYLKLNQYFKKENFDTSKT